MAILYGSLNYTTSGRKKKSVVRRTKKAQPFKPLTASSTYRRDTPEYKSVTDVSGVAAKVDSPKYTGTLVKGIGTMHKSNLIPIIDEQQMKDLARMRR